MKNFYYLFILSFAILTAVPVLAQEQEQEEADIVVVVTAGRVEEETDRIPASVSVLTREDLDAAGQVTLVDALEDLAGVFFRSSTGNAAKAEVSMRGFGESSFGRVLVLLDGHRLNRPDMAGINWLQMPVENIERVEVVRGGNSVLYGDHAVAGVINIITRKGAEKEIAFSVSALGGSFGLNQERVGISGSTGILTYSLNGERTASSGYRQRSAYDSLGFGGNLGLDLTDALSTNLVLSYNRMAYQLPGYLTKAQFEADPTQVQALFTADEAEDQYFNADLGIDAILRDWGSLTANIFYGLKFVKTDMPSGFIPYSDLLMHTLGATPKISLEANPLGFTNSLIFGTDLYWEGLTIDRFSGKDRTNKTFSANLSKSSAGIYARDDIRVLEPLKLSAGARYEVAVITADGTLGTSLSGRKVHQAFVFNAGLVYNFREKSKVYARFEQVYRYPFLDEQVNYYGFGSDQVYTDIEPERGYNIEAGTDLFLFDILILGVNGFLLDMTDEIAYDGTRNINMDKTRHLGAEGSLTLELFGLAKLSGNYTYTLTTFLEGADAGKEVPLVPNHQAYGELTFFLPLGFSTGGGVRYVSRSYRGGDTANTQEPVSDYLLVELNVSYKPDYIPGDLKIFFSIENLLDTRYAPYIYYNGYYPAPGRNWKVGGSYRY